MKRIIISLVAVMMVIPAIHAQKTIIGTVDYKYTLKGEGAAQMAGMMPEKMMMTYGKNGMSVEMTGGMMSSAMGKTIVNGNTGEVFIVKDSEKTIYLMNSEEIKTEAEKVDDTEIEKQEETREIQGYKCQKYIQTTVVQGMNMTQVLWITKDLKTPDYEGEAFKAMAGQGNMSYEIEGFPMLMEIGVPGMPMTVELEVSNIEFKKVDESSFEKPEGYTVKDFSELSPY